MLVNVLFSGRDFGVQEFEAVKDAGTKLIQNMDTVYYIPKPWRLRTLPPKSTTLAGQSGMLGYRNQGCRYIHG